MAGLTKKDTLRIAELAKLKLVSSEIDKFTQQLSEVLHIMDELREVNTKNIEPINQTNNMNVLRNDEIDTTDCLTQDEALSGTNKIKNGFFVVPQILHK